MPELRIEETSPDLKIVLREDDGSEQTRIFNRPRRKPIDWPRCKAKGKGDINAGKSITVQMPEEKS